MCISFEAVGTQSNGKCVMNRRRASLPVSEYKLHTPLKPTCTLKGVIVFIHKHLIPVERNMLDAAAIFIHVNDGLLPIIRIVNYSRPRLSFLVNSTVEQLPAPSGTVLEE